MSQPAGPQEGASDRRSRLRADCSRCAGLCCVAPAFVASADFALTKPAGQACPHLSGDFSCGIHAELRPRGFPGCSVYDCFGAGQQVVQVSFGGQSWRDQPELATQMFATFHRVRQLHELLWYLSEARALPAAAPLHPALDQAIAVVERLTAAAPEELAEVDLAAERRAVDPLLARASELARAGVGSPRARRRWDRPGADLMGRDLRRLDLGGCNLRGAYLIWADLRGAALHLTDLLGADLRSTDVRGTDLTTSLFLTQFQVNAARGDATTNLPDGLQRPPHWTP